MMVTHTHIVTEFANPYLRCDECEERVKGFVDFDGQTEGCFHQGELLPCGHIGVHSICPSWSPVYGCRCIEELGHRYHALDKTERKR